MLESLYVKLCGSLWFLCCGIGRRSILRFKAVQTELLESYSVQGWKAKPGIWRFTHKIQEAPLNSWDLMNFKAVCSSGVSIQFIEFGCFTADHAHYAHHAHHASHIGIEYPYPTLVKRSAHGNTSSTALLLSFPLGFATPWLSIGLLAWMDGRRTAVCCFDNSMLSILT